MLPCLMYMKQVSPITLTGDRMSSLFPRICVLKVSATERLKPSRYMREITTSPFWLMKSRAPMLAMTERPAARPRAAVPFRRAAP